MDHIVPLSFSETFGGEPYQVPFVVIAELGQDHSSGISVSSQKCASWSS